MTSGKGGPSNVYDQTEFFAGYKALRQGDTGLNGALEVPAMRRLLPPLAGKTVVDLGCGFGEFARFAREQGARFVLAVDQSGRMLDEARSLTNDPGIRFVHAAMETFEVNPGSCDLVTSSLALHYVEDLEGVARRVWAALRPRGVFIFSVEHPVCTANPVGWLQDGEGRRAQWPLDCYQDEGPRDTRWFVEGVRKYHRTVETYVTTLLSAGFLLEALVEPTPTPAALSVRPDLKDDLRRPPVLLLSWSREG